MDSLTHVLVGPAMARAGLAQKVGRGTTGLLLLASVAPDVDVVLSFTGLEDPALLRRGVTHSVLGVPVLAGMVAVLARTWMRTTPFRTLYGLALLGGVVHVALDLLNSYGVVPLAPFSDWRPELAWVFIIDLAVWGLLVVPWLLRWTPARRLGTRRAFATALAGLCVYVALCGLGRWRASARLDDELARLPFEPEFRYVFPEPFGPLYWRGVAREGTLYRRWLIHAVTGEIEEIEPVRTELDDPVVSSARRTRRGNRLEWFFKAPVWRRVDDTAAEVLDLRFRAHLLPARETPFVYRVSGPRRVA